MLNYLESNNLRKKKSSKKSYLNILSHIPIEIERELHRCILKHIDDKEIMAIILIKCHGVSISRVCSMRWNEIEEIEDQILIKGQNNNTGSFHRMDRPILFEGAFLIKEKKKRLLESVGDPDKVAKSLVVPIRKGKNMTESQLKSRLTKYIRNILIEAGLEPSQISAAAPNERSVGGSGVKLLQKHFAYVLQERCGLDLDSAEGKFMRGLVPDDTTNIYYRSLSDKYSGIPFLLTIVRRDDFFLPRRHDAPEVSVMKCDKAIEYRIPSPGPGRKLQVSIPKTYLQSGTRIVITAGYGTHGELLFSDYLSSDDISERKIY